MWQSRYNSTRAVRWLVGNSHRRCFCVYACVCASVCTGYMCEWTVCCHRHTIRLRRSLDCFYQTQPLSLAATRRSVYSSSTAAAQQYNSSRVSSSCLRANSHVVWQDIEPRQHLARCRWAHRCYRSKSVKGKCLLGGSALAGCWWEHLKIMWCGFKQTCRKHNTGEIIVA